ncbi:unnamed protein product [Strongylus vulgaris]|uniref:Uncharacterized protein n=1 Tax=Strongylus vulgaris TaxID=40348 RepID=A0A3P7JGM1_STRVU|nr:unnamed protein product [Strongylus vulgaris]
MYSVLEHAFRQREGDEQRTFLALRPLVAPIKCSILPISANERLNPIIEAAREELARFDLTYRVVGFLSYTVLMRSDSMCYF